MRSLVAAIVDAVQVCDSPSHSFSGARRNGRSIDDLKPGPKKFLGIISEDHRGLVCG